jgi:putative membrane protein
MAAIRILADILAVDFAHDRRTSPRWTTVTEDAPPMIRNFSDHAANERTFLAWVRTAIAVMAFGFLVAKFNLFLKVAAESLARDGQAIPVPGGGFGGVAGIILILAGTAIVAFAALRFIHTGRAIDSQEPKADGTWLDLTLAGLMALLGIALLVYLGHTLLVGL